MRKYEVVLFDLDGTLTASGEGITKSVQYALNKMGKEEMGKDLKALEVFIGPPLLKQFMAFCDITEDEAELAVKYYRERYTVTGIFENHPYPGIENALQTLKAQGHRLFVATSKPEVMANKVLEHFGLAEFFEQVVGATLDGSRIHKEDVITYLLGLTGDVGQTLMVGDTAFDVIGAKAHGICTIGVSWGYGKVEDMVQAGAIAIAHTMKELVSLVNQ